MNDEAAQNKGFTGVLAFVPHHFCELRTGQQWLTSI